MKNYATMKNATAIKSQVRIAVMEVITKVLPEAFGKVYKVDTNEYAVIIGTTKDKSGNKVPITVTVKPTVKEWEDRKTDKKFSKQDDIAFGADIIERMIRLYESV